MFTVYQVWRETDMTEPRAPMKPVVAFTSEQDAWECANKQSGIMGRKPKDGDWRTYSDGRDWDVKPLVVYQTYQESDRAHKEQLKKAALAKLTEAEKQVLGLTT